MNIPKIINLDSKYDLTHAEIAFISEVLTTKIEEPKTYLRNPSELFSHLIQEIPVFLLSKVSMPNYEPLIKFDSERPSTEILGFYKHKGNLLGVETPVIGICPERIRDCVSSEHEYIILVAKVIVHEFAHAKLASNEILYNPRDEFYEWMEESMANLITLEFFRNHKIESVVGAYPKSDPFKFVHDFVKLQPPNYRMAADLYDKNLWCWFRWMTRKDKVQNLFNKKADFVNYARDVYVNGKAKFDPVIAKDLLTKLNLLK
jgi:hypothetical protein